MSLNLNSPQNPQLEKKNREIHFRNELALFSQEEGVWNGYVIVKNNHLQHVNIFELIYEKLYKKIFDDNPNIGISIKVVCNYLEKNEKFIKTDNDIEMVKALAKKACITPNPPTTKDFANNEEVSKLNSLVDEIYRNYLQININKKIKVDEPAKEPDSKQYKQIKSPNEIEQKINDIFGPDEGDNATRRGNKTKANKTVVHKTDPAEIPVKNDYKIENKKKPHDLGEEDNSNGENDFQGKKQDAVSQNEIIIIPIELNEEIKDLNPTPSSSSQESQPDMEEEPKSGTQEESGGFYSDNQSSNQKNEKKEIQPDILLGEIPTQTKKTIEILPEISSSTSYLTADSPPFLQGIAINPEDDALIIHAESKTLEIPLAESRTEPELEVKQPLSSTSMEINNHDATALDPDVTLAGEVLKLPNAPLSTIQELEYLSDTTYREQLTLFSQDGYFRNCLTEKNGKLTKAPLIDYFWQEFIGVTGLKKTNSERVESCLVKFLEIGAVNHWIRREDLDKVVILVKRSGLVFNIDESGLVFNNETSKHQRLKEVFTEIYESVQGSMFLINAVYDSNLDIKEAKLIAGKASKNLKTALLIQDNLGQTPILYAAFKDNLPMLQLMADTAPEEFGKALTILSGNGLTPVYLAAYNDNLLLLQLMANAAPEGFGKALTIHSGDKFTPVHLAVKKDSLPMLQLMADTAPEEFGKALTIHSGDGLTPVYEAARNDNLPLLQLMVDTAPEEFGKALKIHSGDGLTPVYNAVSNNNLPLLQLMADTNPKEFGKALTIHSGDGLTPVYNAVSNNNLPLLQLMANAAPEGFGKALTILSGNGYTPVYGAMLDDNLPLLQLMANAAPEEFGKTLTIHSGDGYTPVYNAVSDNNLPLLQLMANAAPEEFGKALTILSGDGFTPVYNAVSDNNLQ